MFGPFYSTVFLAFQVGNVIGLRMMKIMSGGNGFRDEAYLMVMEKVHAVFEASASLLVGGTASTVVDRYREHVAANAKRLLSHIEVYVAEKKSSAVVILKTPEQRMLVVRDRL